MTLISTLITLPNRVIMREKKVLFETKILRNTVRFGDSWSHLCVINNTDSDMRGVTGYPGSAGRESWGTESKENLAGPCLLPKC